MGGGGPCDSRDVWDLRPLSRSLGLGSRKRRRWCGGMRNAGVSVDILYLPAAEMQPCGRLACLCPKGSKYVTVRARGRPAHRLLSFPFSDGHFFFSVSSLLITSIRGRASISPSSLLLFPSSSRTRNLHRPARLNLSFFLGGTGIRKRGGGGHFFFLSKFPFPPYPTQA